MISFLASLSWIGWLIIALALFTLWNLRSIVEMALFGDALSRNRLSRGRRDSTGHDPNDD